MEPITSTAPVALTQTPGRWGTRSVPQRSSSRPRSSAGPSPGAGTPWRPPRAAPVRAAAASWPQAGRLGHRFRGGRGRSCRGCRGRPVPRTPGGASPRAIGPPPRRGPARVRVLRGLCLHLPPAVLASRLADRRNWDETEITQSMW